MTERSQLFPDYTDRSRPFIPEGARKGIRYSGRFGIYEKNWLTDYTDKKLKIPEFAEDGLNLENYILFLRWQYEVIAKVSQRYNPTGMHPEELKDLESASAFWLMSFKEKGFDLQYGQVSRLHPRVGDKNLAIGAVSLSRNDGFSLERESFPDRLERPFLIERIYDVSTDELVATNMLIAQRAPNRCLFRPYEPGDKMHSSWVTDKLVTIPDNLHNFHEISDRIDEHLNLGGYRLEKAYKEK